MLGDGPRIAARCVTSIAVMAPWPLLGILLLHSQFDHPSEGLMFLGGITMFPLMLLLLFGVPPEGAIMAVVALVWVAAALLPNVLLRDRLASRAAMCAVLGAQSLFALAQAVMAALLVIGKSV